MSKKKAKMLITFLLFFLIATEVWLFSRYIQLKYQPELERIFISSCYPMTVPTNKWLAMSGFSYITIDYPPSGLFVKPIDYSIDYYYTDDPNLWGRFRDRNYPYLNQTYIKFLMYYSTQSGDTVYAINYTAPIYKFVYNNSEWLTFITNSSHRYVELAIEVYLMIKSENETTIDLKDWIHVKFGIFRFRSDEEIFSLMLTYVIIVSPFYIFLAMCYYFEAHLPRKHLSEIEQ